MKVINFFILTILMVLGEVLFSNQQEEQYRISKPSDPNYIAGVVEFQPSSTRDVKEQLEGYKKIIESDDAKPADIIVFPEATFNSMRSLLYVPSPEDNITFCNNITILSDSKTTQNASELEVMSCLAKKHKKYILINLTEKENCTVESQKKVNDSRPCAANGLNIYNTNVVFDRNGTIISRYRKWNLFNESNTNTTAKPEYAIFNTDFGVKFAHFTCFDILFYSPTQELVNKGVKDFLYPTMWYSELPFLTAVQTQQSWAYANDVNLLAAGASEPSKGSTGTGVFAGKKGSLVKVMSSKPERKIYVVQVEKKNIQNIKTSLLATSIESTATNVSSTSNNNTKNTIIVNNILKELKLLRDNKLDSYNKTLLKFNSSISTEQHINETICYKDLCCKFSIKLTLNNSTINKTKENEIINQKSYEYVLVVYEGERSYQNVAKTYLRVCGIIPCTNQSNFSSCGQLFSSNVDVINPLTFNDIQIEGNFNKNNNTKSLIMPTTLDESLLPLSAQDFNFDIEAKNDTNRIVKLKLNSPKSNLFTFGIYVNDFEAPVEHPKGQTDSSAGLTFSVSTLISSLIMIYICYIQFY